MKAAVLHEFKTPLALSNVPRPEPDSNEVLIQVEACGVCHSDLHLADGDWKQLSRIVKRPLILGHEIAGRVVEVGGAVRDRKVGDRVGVPWIYWTCGECEFCTAGNENLCVKQKLTGATVDGGFAEFVKAPASHATPIPDALSSIEAAPLFCAGVTVYRALKKARILGGQRLAVFGVGGLGHLGIQIGCALGAEVAAVDISEEKLALAKACGASHVFNAVASDAVKELRRLGGMHVVMVASPSKAAYDAAFASLRPGGTLLVVGLPAEPICFQAVMMAAVEVCIQASAVGTRRDLEDVLKLGAAGKIKCHVRTRPLADVNQVMDELRRGQISGRVALTL